MAFWRNRAFWKFAPLALLALGVLIASRFLPLENWIGALVAWIEQQGPAGMAIFAAAYVVAMVLCLWGTPFTVAAGAVFGTWWGTVIATFSATTGSALAFLIARYLAREAVARRAARHPKFEALDAAIGRHGWWVVFLTRFSPLIPFSFSNYLFGVTKVRFGQFVGASVLAILPGSFVVAYLGHIGRLTLLDGFAEAGAWQYALIGGAAVFTAGVGFYFARIAKRALAEAGRDR